MLFRSADDAFSFLAAWEFMSLTSWALVVAHHKEPENIRAGYVYLLMASFGTLALVLAFGLLAGGNGSYAFAAMRATRPSAGLASLVLILALVDGLMLGWLVDHDSVPSGTELLASVIAAVGPLVASQPDA